MVKKYLRNNISSFFKYFCVIFLIYIHTELEDSIHVLNYTCKCIYAHACRHQYLCLYCSTDDASS